MTKNILHDIVQKEFKNYKNYKINNSSLKTISKKIKQTISNYPTVKWCITTSKINDSNAIIKIGISLTNGERLVVKAVVPIKEEDIYFKRCLRNEYVYQ